MASWTCSTHTRQQDAANKVDKKVSYNSGKLTSPVDRLAGRGPVGRVFSQDILAPGYHIDVI
jgi:hypothetical protein